MKVADAIELIERAFRQPVGVETWADLGCGSGTFTRALATLLGERSIIYAVDKENQHIKTATDPAASINFLRLDFIRDPLPYSELDGILMANAIHYVSDKASFIEKLKQHLKPDGKLLIVEYDTDSPNAWVPYPLSFDRLTQLFSQHGFGKIEKLKERSSIFRSGKMYACVIRF